MSARVLIVGCGELGSRHLQAVATLPETSEIEVVDPRPAALDMGRQRLSELVTGRPEVKVRWLTSIEEAAHSGDLCVIATQADVRCEVMHRVARTVDYRSYLLEKIVAQSVADYERLLALQKEKGIGVWVNCKGRAHPSHKRVKEHLHSSMPILLTFMGGNQGLANNGIHAADLFLFYDGTDNIESAGGKIDMQLHTSKRGAGVFDLSGTMVGYSSKGSRLILSFGEYAGPVYFTVDSPTYRVIVDDMAKTLYEGTATTGWAWTPIRFDADLRVSEMTKKFAREILAHGRCELPTLLESFPAHRFILSELQPHFNRLLRENREHCPVT